MVQILECLVMLRLTVSQLNVVRFAEPECTQMQENVYQVADVCASMDGLDPMLNTQQTTEFWYVHS